MPIRVYLSPVIDDPYRAKVRERLLARGVDLTGITTASTCCVVPAGASRYPWMRRTSGFERAIKVGVISDRPAFTLNTIRPLPLPHEGPPSGAMIAVRWSWWRRVRTGVDLRVCIWR